MSVYSLNDGKLLRVARSIDGKLHQEYFSLVGLSAADKKITRARAQALDAKWAAQQKKAKLSRAKETVPGRGHSTGVRGINIVYRPSAAFRVQVQSEGLSKVREFSIKRLGREAAWLGATKYLAQVRGFKSVPRQWRAKTPRVPRKPS